MKNKHPKLSARSLAKSALSSAISSIELFNRPRSLDRMSLSIIANIRAWEQLGKAFLIRKNRNIYFRNSRTYSAEKIIRIIHSSFNEITPGESDTIHQIISLRNEAMHSDLDYIPDDLAAHLLYFSLKSFKKFLKKHFPSYSKELNSNFISINFQQVYTYGARINRLISSSRNQMGKNRILFLLERGVHYSRHGKEISEEQWLAKIRSLRGKRITQSSLYLKKYATEHENVFFITVEAPSKYGHAEVTLSKGSHSAKTKISIVTSDPEQSHPFLTSDLANKLNRGRNKVLDAIKILRLKGNKDYHIAVRSGKGNFIQKYSEKAFLRLKDYFDKITK